VDGSTRVLVVDDDRAITASLRRALGVEGYEVSTASNGTEALAALDGPPWDLLVLDIALPDIDGLEICRRVRARGDLPILMLTARDETSDRVAGLDSGADDYLVKPFALEELLARSRALLRRQRARAAAEDEILQIADLRMNLSAHAVERAGRRIDLSAKEFDLLRFLLANPRQVFSRDTLLDRVWGRDFGGESNVADVYIGYLRTKLEAAGEPRLIHTVRGVGYVMRDE
jgi:two-component system response regulator MprA